MRIQAQKYGSMTETDRLDMARILIKAGYVVRIGKEKASGKPNAAYIQYLEYVTPGQKFTEEETA